MVQITEKWINDLLDLGDNLNQAVMRKDVDIFTIMVEPEFGYVHIKAIRHDENLFEATRYGIMDNTTIKIAPRGAATPIGARNNNVSSAF